MCLAWQTFADLRVRTAKLQGAFAPIIMDASVSQIDRFRVVHLLPLSPTKILTQDSRCADAAALDEAAIEAILQREVEVLPIIPPSTGIASGSRRATCRA